MSTERKLFSIVFPVYQNGKNLPHLAKEIADFINSFNKYDLEFVFVDDGSTDDSFKQMQNIKDNFGSQVKLIQLSKNFGQGSAMRCGWEYASGDYIGNISSDQQDPLILFKKMLKLVDINTEIVLATRSDRNDGVIINFCSSIFYFFVKKFIIPDFPFGGCDVYLFSKNVKNYLLLKDERGNHNAASLINSGFHYEKISYTRKKRKHGKNQTKILKRITVLIDIIVSNSHLPIRFISSTGLIIGIFGIGFGIFIIIQRLINLSSTEHMGWASTISLLSIFSGLILFSLGIIGEYFWRIMENFKKDPLFSVKKRTID